MTGKDKHALGAKMLDKLIQGQRAGKSHAEITEGLRAGMSSDYLSLDEGLKRGATVADPAKYTRAMDGKDERPRKTGPIVRDINERIERAKAESAAITGSQEYREKVIRQKKNLIHKAMDQRGTNELTANIRGYDVTLIRLPETDKDGLQHLKIFVDGNEIPDKQFGDALAEVAGLNDSQAFNTAADIGKNLRDQAGIQGARTLTQAGIGLVAAPGKAIARSHQKNGMIAGEIMRLFLRMILSMSRAR